MQLVEVYNRNKKNYEVVKNYRSDINIFVVNEKFHEFLDFMAVRCDKFALYSENGYQLYSEEFMDKYFDKDEEFYEYCRQDHSKYGYGKDPLYLLDIPEYSVLKKNVISHEAVEGGMLLSGCRSKYTFNLNAETLAWLKQFNSCKELYFAVKKETEVIKDISEYAFTNLSFIRDGEKIFYEGDNHILMINDAPTEELVLKLSKKSRSAKKKLFVKFRDKFNIIKTTCAKGDIDARSIEFMPEMYSPYHAVRNLLMNNKTDEEIKNLYYDEDNMTLLAKLFVKAIELNNMNELCFDWLDVYRDKPAKKLKGEDVIVDYLRSLDRAEFIKLCDKEIRKIITRRIWIIIGLCKEKGIDSNEFSYPSNMIINEYSEMMPFNSGGECDEKEYVFSHMYSKIINKIEQNSKREIDCRNLLTDPKHDSIVNRTPVGIALMIRNAYAYYYGIGLNRDLEQAFYYLNIVAKHYPDCQYDLAKCYLNGWGTEKDTAQARHWFAEAAKNGHPKASEQLELLEKAEFEGRTA